MTRWLQRLRDKQLARRYMRGPGRLPTPEQAERYRELAQTLPPIHYHRKGDSDG